MRQTHGVCEVYEPVDPEVVQRLQDLILAEKQLVSGLGDGPPPPTPPEVLREQLTHAQADITRSHAQ